MHHYYHLWTQIRREPNEEETISAKNSISVFQRTASNLFHLRWVYMRFICSQERQGGAGMFGQRSGEPKRALGHGLKFGMRRVWQQVKCQVWGEKRRSEYSGGCLSLRVWRRRRADNNNSAPSITL